MLKGARAVLRHQTRLCVEAVGLLFAVAFLSQTKVRRSGSIRLMVVLPFLSFDALFEFTRRSDSGYGLVSILEVCIVHCDV